MKITATKIKRELEKNYGWIELQAKKLDPNDPEVKRLIAETIKAQEEILALKKWDAESMRQVITI